jgi:hypothetical protein
MKRRDELASIRCLSADAFLTFALKAYYAAGRRILEDFKASGEPWLLDGEPWASRSTFLEALHSEITHQLSLVAARQRLRATGSCSAVLNWYEPPEDRGAGFVPVFSGPQVNNLHPAPEPCEASPDAAAGAGVTA